MGWNLKKLVALCTSAALLVSCVPVAYAEGETWLEETAGGTQDIQTETGEKQESVQIVAELPELRGEDEKHFRLSDGSMMAAKYPDAVHYETEGGWEEIDNTLCLKQTDDSVYINQENAFKVAFAETSDAAELVRLEQDGYVLSWALPREPQEGPALFSSGHGDIASVKAQVMAKEDPAEEAVTGKAPENMQDKLSGGPADTAADGTAVQDGKPALPADDPALQVEKASSGIVYADVRPGMDLQYILSGSQLKENLIVERPMDTYTFT